MEQINDEPLKNQLAKYRKKLKLSQGDAALYTNSPDRQKIAKYESGKLLPRIDKAARFAALYKTKVEKLYPAEFIYARLETMRLLSLYGKKTFKSTIMALYPGTHQFGVAVFPSPQKVKAFVRNINVDSTRVVRHWRQVILTLVKRFDPKVLIIERIRPTDRRRGRLLKRIITAIKEIAKKYKIKIIEYLNVTVYRALIPPLLRQTKAQLPPILAGQYPQLKRFELRTRRRVGETEPYFMRLFMAVALGMTYFYRRAEPQ